MKIDPPPLQSDIWRQNFEMKIATKFDNFRDRVEILLLRFKVSSLLFFFFSFFPLLHHFVSLFIDILFFFSMINTHEAIHESREANVASDFANFVIQR